MKKKSTLKIFAAVFCIASSHAYSGTFLVPKPNETTIGSNHKTALPPSVYDLDPLIVISQNVNEKGLVVMSGQFSKPFTDSNILLSIKYQNTQGEWVTAWCKTLYSYNQYNESLKATFELPASVNPTYNLKVELTSDTNSFTNVAWNKTVNHYKQGDYAVGNCDLDENEYTMLLTPKKAGTLLTDANGKATGIKDRVTSAYSWNKLGNVLMDNKKNDVVFSPTNPSDIITESNDIKSIKLLNTGAISNTLGSTPEFIYNEAAGHPIPYLYSYDDPVYMFAGKFSANGFFMKFSQWPGEPDGPGYFNFKEPTKVESRYFNLYNRTWKNLSEIIPDQEPVVIVSSLATGLRIYKSDGTFIDLNPNTTSNYGGPYFGYTNSQGVRRGPGSENLIISDTSEMTLYGVGALRNAATATYQTVRSLQDIEKEISKFIKYTGIFGNTTSYKNDASECSVNCFTINPGAQPTIAADWTKAPNSYIFTGKDKNGNAVDGLYIPVKKAYEMWAKGGDFMKDDTQNYTPIPSGAATAGLYWEDEPGLVKSITLEGSGQDAKIKVMMNGVKEGNASISYKVNGEIYWTWHIWATDDPSNGSTYHHGFEKDKNGNVVTDWKWMDRNLGATSANFVGNEWHKSAGLQYQWGRKDPFPSFGLKDLSLYSISGEINLAYTDPAFQSKFVKIRGNKYSAERNTGTDTPNGNIRFSIKNPINFIATPVYVAKYGEPLLNDDEDFLQQKSNGLWQPVGMTTWFSKKKYKKYVPPYRENIIAWDLWGDTRQGNYSDLDDPAVGEASSRYALKSPYDPCPCNWRVPSSYFSGGRNSGTPMPDENRYSPWGKHTGNVTDSQFKPDVLNADYPGIKVYPQFGFDFSGVAGMNLGKFPINGNYEGYPNTTSALKYGTGWVTPVMEFQDQSADGGLVTSTFITASEVINGVRYPTFNAAGLTLISDPLSTSFPRPGWHRFSGSPYIGGGGVRCIYDPNNSLMPKEFETEFISSGETYSLETLKSWTKLPNSYVEYTNPALVTPNPNGNKIDPNKDNDRIIEIPLRKAYAMHKLHLSTDFSFPAESTKSSSVVWTSNTNLIQKMEIINGSIDGAVLKVTLNQNQTGNAVVAFHVGTGTWTANKHNDPVVWSWHIWAPKSVIETYTFDPENAGNGGVIPTNGQFVDPMTSAGVPMKTTFMDRDLGAKDKLVNGHIYEPSGSVFASGLAAPTTASFPTGNPAVLARLAQISESGGLHYQWGRKDPLPVFYNPGPSYYNYGTNYAAYNVFRQNNPANATTGAIPYTANIPESDYLTSYTQAYPTYSAVANISASDSKADKLKKIVKYSVNNPLNYLYQSDAAKLDWVSDENGNMPERWGHATEKSAYDPCPAGWRIVDLESVSTGIILGNFISKGNTPWFYNKQFNNAYGIDPGDINAVVKYENYDPAKYNYIGGTLYAYYSGKGAVAYGYTLNRPEYNIGLFPNTGIRGFNGGNTMSDYLNGTSGLKAFLYSGIWTSASQGSGGSSLGMLFKLSSNPYYFLTPTFGFRPQAAMSCRCAEIKYDANGNEIGRYEPFAIPVPSNALAKATNILSKTVIEEKVAQNKLEFFPNPVKSLLHIKGNDKAKDYYYQIYNISGQLVKSGKFENEQTDLSSLPSGVYLVRINNSETIVKIIKQ